MAKEENLRAGAARRLVIYTRFQVEGLNRTRMGKISSRPIIMHRDITPLDSPEKAAKLPLGPMASRPGPTLLTQVRAALKETAKDSPSREMTKAAAKMVIT